MYKYGNTNTILTLRDMTNQERKEQLERRLEFLREEYYAAVEEVNTLYVPYFEEKIHAEHAVKLNPKLAAAVKHQNRVDALYMRVDDLLCAMLD